MTDLDQLTEIGVARARLDDRELELIDRARQSGATWVQVAAALGLASRQAAEQRRQRLVAAARSRRHQQDLRYAHSIVHLRIAIDDLHRGIAADRRWDTRFARAALVRATVATALDAPPSGLYALAAQAVDDLAAEAEGVRRSAGNRAESLPGHVVVAFGALRRALSTDH